MNKKNILFLIIFCLILLLVGFVSGWFYRKIINQDNKIQKELAWCKSSLEIFYPSLPDETYSLTGTVIEIGDDYLIMESNIQVNQFPLPDQEQFELWNIKVNFVDETKVYWLKMVEELLISEIEEELTDPFRKIFLEFKDIKLGELINVFSEENIKNKKEFLASEIELYR